MKLACPLPEKWRKEMESMADYGEGYFVLERCKLELESWLSSLPRATATGDEIVEAAAKDCELKCSEAEDRQDEAQPAASTDCTPDFKYGYESGVAEGFRCAAHRIRALKGKFQLAAAPVDLNPETAELVRNFSLALAEKLAAAQKKYGYQDDWQTNDWMDECRAKLREHVEKGDPRDVAAYCAFLWFHNERTSDGAAAAERDKLIAQAADAATEAVSNFERGLNDGSVLDWDLLQDLVHLAVERLAGGK